MLRIDLLHLAIWYSLEFCIHCEMIIYIFCSEYNYDKICRCSDGSRGGGGSWPPPFKNCLNIDKNFQNVGIWDSKFTFFQSPLPFLNFLFVPVCECLKLSQHW